MVPWSGQRLPLVFVTWWRVIALSCRLALETLEGGFTSKVNPAWSAEETAKRANAELADYVHTRRLILSSTIDISNV